VRGGHWQRIVAMSVYVGMEKAVKEMEKLIEEGN
jgi:pyridoxine 5'-phosphate synthase PdxJ